MEMFYKAFNLTRAFLKADAHVPAPVSLPDAEDRFIAKELESRRVYPLLAVLEVLRDMAQHDLISPAAISEVEPAASLTQEGLKPTPAPEDISEMVSLSPVSLPS